MKRAFNPWPCLLLLGLTACPSHAPMPAPPAIGLSDESVVQALRSDRTGDGMCSEPRLGPGAPPTT